ncbi:oligoendopeptidase F, partial [Staphylococcus aureus]|nr:oligoendopeptidase F [Staphylococcus aureus]
MSQGLPLREDVPVSETWDLVDLFKDDQQYYESIDALVQQANQFHHTYATTLNSIEQINTALAELENILIALDRLSNYAELRLSVDTSNIEAQVLSAKLSTTYGKIVSQLSFVE